MWKKFLEGLLNKILSDLTSRKWLAFLIITVLSFIALLRARITSEVWATIVIAGFGLFSAANVTQKIKASQPNDLQKK
jgi:hypothetical protein